MVRMQPLIPTQIREVVDEFIPRIGETKTKHVIVEFLKLPVENRISNIKDFFEELNWNGYEYYKNYGAIRTGREWVLPPELKWDLLQPVIEKIQNFNMTYGAGDYGLNHLGDTDCCCGIDKIDGFSVWF